MADADEVALEHKRMTNLKGSLIHYWCCKKFHHAAILQHSTAQHSTAQQQTDSDKEIPCGFAMYAGRTGDSHHNTDSLPIKSKISPPPFGKSKPSLSQSASDCWFPLSPQDLNPAANLIVHLLMTSLQQVFIVGLLWPAACEQVSSAGIPLVLHCTAA